MHGTNKKDRSGSLLTPLFKHFGIDLSKYKVNTEIQYLDIKYLMVCHIMRDEDTYSFFDKESTQLFTKLPHPEITRLSMFDNIRFLPLPELLCTDPRAAAPDADMEDVEDITPKYDPSYDLGELADVTDDQAYRRWMVDSQQKNNSLMRWILHPVTGGWIGGSNQRQSPAEQTQRSHSPGKVPIGTGTSTEEVPRSCNRLSCGGSSISLPAAALAEVTSDSHQQSRLHDRTVQERRLWEQALQLRSEKQKNRPPVAAKHSFCCLSLATPSPYTSRADSTIAPSRKGAYGNMHLN
ncbi:hypothetical protein F2Q69_00045980 [Brassica cretica]|uniref:Arabidopsis retrotransposon Orf1 C-terminal domain-containing protein n=1 Tax=Brassica cretica TaxID=69181 RepID=A0A8S9PJQ4_BRACR|nr:hypothetical protein F2Q69_00045980 [Brassica cretica]